MAKYWCTDLQSSVADRGVQLHGGWGYMWEYDVCKHFVDARVQSIYGNMEREGGGKEGGRRSYFLCVHDSPGCMCIHFHIVTEPPYHTFYMTDRARPHPTRRHDTIRPNPLGLARARS